MRFVEAKTPEEQGRLMLHHTRQLFVVNRLSYSIRSALILPSSGSSRRSEATTSLPMGAANECLRWHARVLPLSGLTAMLKTQIRQFDRLIPA
jgi:hypothetical protein